MELRYYEPELGLDGTAEELFIQARNNYIDNPDALSKISSILNSEAAMNERNGLSGKDLRIKAEKVHYMELRERETDTDFSINQMKIDFMDCGKGGLDEVPINEDKSLFLSVMFEPRDSNVIFSLTQITDDGTSIGASSLSLDQFKNCTRRDFDNFVGQILMLGMQPV